ncbi:MAG: nucleoside-triphosphatase [Bacteroidetes bacterium]|nr:nucleoside-triphosphatase [Bacteroidota bacterium]
MGFFAVFFLVAASVKWKVRGLVWRAGVICALMKFFSPGVAVFGPMIGIMSEALALELAISIFGFNLSGFLIGGILAESTPLIQKIINYIIVYGWNIVIVLDKSAEVIIKTFGANGIKPAHLLMILFSVNIVLGIIASVSGYISGRKNTGRNFLPEFKQTDDTLYPEFVKANPKTIIVSVLLNTAVTVILLFFIKGNIFTAGILIVLFVIYSLFRYRNTARIFKNYKFWLQLVFFTSLSGLVFAYFSGFGLSKGIETGMEMLERVILLTVGFAIISIELRKPESVNFIRSKLNRNLSLGLNSAFSAVPEIISSSKGIFSLMRPAVFIEELTSMMDYWYEKFRVEIRNGKIVIVTGRQGAGKSALLKKLSEEYANTGKKVSGIISFAVFENGERTGYDAVEIPSMEKYHLCGIEETSGTKLGRYYFDDSVFEKINAKMEDSLGSSDVIIADEIGILETNKKGWYPLMEKIKSRADLPLVVLSVRKNITEEIKSYFGSEGITVYDLDTINPGEALEKILSNSVNG